MSYISDNLISLNDVYGDEAPTPTPSTNLVEQMKTQLNVLTSEDKGRLVQELAGEGEEDFPSA
jgi:hypothetical protein